jgi:hypothetical protein
MNHGTVFGHLLNSTAVVLSDTAWSIYRPAVNMLQVRNRLLTTVLLIRCDYTTLLTFLNDRKGETNASSPSVQVDLSLNRYAKLV